MDLLYQPELPVKRGKKMNCEICGRRTESKLCILHEEARKNLLKNYEAWRRSMNVSWEEYLREIQQNPFAGIWAKEVAHHLLVSGSANEQEGLAKGTETNK